MTRIHPSLPLLQGGRSAGSSPDAVAGPARSLPLAHAPPNFSRLGAGAIIEGIVIGRDERGLTQVRTDHGVLTFRTQLALPRNTQLIMQIQTSGSQIQVGILSVRLPAAEGEAPNPKVAGAAPGPPAHAASHDPGTLAEGVHSILGLTREWPALQQVLTAAAGAKSPAAPILRTMVPSPGPNFAPTLLFFIAALTRGNFGAWLGPNAQKALAAIAGREASERLARDFSRLSRLATQGTNTDWRVFLIPVADGPRVEQIQFFVRRRREGGDSEDPNQSLTRFIFEFALSRFGRMQLDGLTGPHRFDLIVRSLSPLPQHVRADIAGIFAAARAQSKLAGDVAFQVVSSFPVAPLSEAIGTDEGVVV